MPTGVISWVLALELPRPWIPPSAAWASTGQAPLELIGRSLNDAGPENARNIYSGCGTDHLLPSDARSLDDVIRAYLEQLHAIQKLGGRIILMASRALVRVAKSPDDYVKVYSRVLSETDHPAILHWLGDMFDPALKGYWGSASLDRATDTCLSVIAANAAKVDGIKVSLLDDKKEIEMRRRLPATVKMYTGDDFNYPDLIAGDQKGFSHALLGIFDAIAPAASQALTALARGDLKKYNALLAPTVPLSRLIFRAPTQFYKTGIVFLAWLNGHQDHFVMVGGAQSMRPITYFCGILPPGRPSRTAAPSRSRREANAPASRGLWPLMRVLAGHPEHCAINTATFGFQDPIEKVIDAVARRGYGGIAPWRREIEGHDIGAIARRIRDAGLQVTGYCRSTYIPAGDQKSFAANIESNKRAIDDAATLGAFCFVMVVGSLPVGSKDIAAARAQVAEATAVLLEHGRQAGVRIALEPLHPVYAAERSCLTLLSEALDICGSIEGDAADPWLGTCVDVYHVWWDPNLKRDLQRAGADRRIFGFHVCDWLVPTTDVLDDRGMMGDGVIDVPGIRRDVEAAGYRGLVEVEIFSATNWWTRPMEETLRIIAERFASAT